MATTPKLIPLRPPKAPNLPIGPVSYSQQFQDQFSNVLRLYFAEIDNLAAGYAQGTFGNIIKFPNIGAYYYPEQYATAANTPTIVLWNDTSSLYGFTLNVDNTATALYPGIYKITYSLQLANNDNAAHDVICWLRVNGNTAAADVDNSTTIFTVPARKSAGIPSYVGAYSEVVFQLNAGDSVGLWWGTDQAATSGGATGTWIYARAAQTTPMPYPETPSAIGSITFVSAPT